MAEVSRALLERDDDGAAAPEPGLAAAEQAMADLLDGLGWDVTPCPEVIPPLAEAFVAFRETCDPGMTPDAFLGYAHAVDRLAQAEIAFTMARTAAADSRDVAIETMVAGTVIGERALAAFRRAAHVHYAALATSARPSVDQ
jgi:hypothetical protein